MKIRLLTIALMAAVVGFGACSKKNKSSEKAITKFVVGTVEYQLNESTKTFKHIYPKSTTTAGTWPTEPSWPIAPQITFSDKASIDPPATVPQNFITAPVVYTVTAEDGTKATYTVTAERGTN